MLIAPWGVNERLVTEVKRLFLCADGQADGFDVTITLGKKFALRY